MIKKIIVFSGIFLLVFSSFLSIFTYPVFASDLNKIKQEIDQKNKEKQELEKKINQLKNQINIISSSNQNLYQKISELQQKESEIKEAIQELDKKISETEELLNLYERKLKERQDEINLQMNYLFKLSFYSDNQIISQDKEILEYINDLLSANAKSKILKDEIEKYYREIQKTNETKAQLVSDREANKKYLEELSVEIQKINQQIAYNNSIISSSQQQINTLSSNLASVISQLNFLSAEQKRLLEEERRRMNSGQRAMVYPLEPGEYYFTGRGRDLVEGHGLGMSQWGAHGMALAGFNYEQILKHYYTGIEITEYEEPEKVIVTTDSTGRISTRIELTVDDYLSGLGEVPNTWPAEAVKAQVVAARTYLMGTCGNKKVCEICGSAACQVYIGGQGKRTFVEETKGKVMTYQGQPIVAYYSASHRGHSTTINSAWGSTDKPYIQPVNDDQWATKTYYTRNPYKNKCTNDEDSLCKPDIIYPYNWIWRTNSFSYDELSEILKRDSRTDVGKIVKIEIVKDVSNRVSRIHLYGENGIKKTLTGWDFRAIYNIIVPDGDYIYSTEFEIRKVQ